jgi:hypothetical protein
MPLVKCMCVVVHTYIYMCDLITACLYIYIYDSCGFVLSFDLFVLVIVFFGLLVALFFH